MATQRKPRTSSPGPTEKKDGKDEKQRKDKNVLKAFFDGFAGTVEGSFFKEPTWVDKTLPPGRTSQEKTVSENPKLRNYLTGSFVIWSPNFVWLLFGLFDYLVFPYDIKAAKSWAPGWVLWRLVPNSLIVFGYVSFWHVTLYVLKWGKRPFNQSRTYRFSKVAHNAFYNMLGVIQWTLVEAIFMHCYATGRLPYISDQESFGTRWGLAQFVFSFFWVCLYRDCHFYFCHRIIHLRTLYKYVHSIHHRNTDIEPFAGLSMHPIEHLYYFSCALLSLYVHASPFAFMFNGVHLLISPAASHSGFEDNMQSDQYHYLHHRYFECNYGTPSVPYDYWFGTYREGLDAKSNTYKGEYAGPTDAKVLTNLDSKATLLAKPDWDQVVYNIFACVLIPCVIAASALGCPWARKLAVPGLDNAKLLALLGVAGPALVAMVLLVATTKDALKRPFYTFLYPFHKEKLFGAFGLNMGISVLVSVVPVYHMFHMLLSEPGQGIYFSLYSQ